MMFRKKHTKLWIVLFVCVVVSAVFFFFLQRDTLKEYKALPVSIGGVSYTVALADTEQKRAQGLSGTKTLPYDGMLFVFDTPNTYSFWMKDMSYPLDFIWLDGDKKVVDLHTDIAPESYPNMITPAEPALYVLEVASDFIQRNGIKKGDILSF